MYSRAERKFLAPDADHANPNLGPGCYTADEAALIAGKTLGINGYAPFASLAPRKSYFEDSVVSGPAPGAYDAPITQVGLHNVDKAALFGRSRAPRFDKIVSTTPGPGSYVIPGSIRGKKRGQKGSSAFARTDMAMVIGNPLAQEPTLLGGSSASLNGAKPEKKRVSISAGEMRSVGDPAANTEIGSFAEGEVYEDNGHTTRPSTGPTESFKERIPNVRGGVGGDVSGVEARRMQLSARQSKTTLSASPPPPTADSKIDRKKPAIIWRRKYIPPSIPVGHSAFGYQENEDGELVPRKPPKRDVDPGPAYNFNTSFVERAKHERQGYTFGKDHKGLKFKIHDSPGPCLYNAEASDKFLHGHDSGTGPALMTLAPCTRLTDAIVAEERKKGVPGPGAYEIKYSFQDQKNKNTIIPAFGGTSSHANINYIPLEQMKTPGPGSYYPELANLPKPFLFKPQPFGSTTNRFDGVIERRIQQLPAPGSYELDAIDSIIGKIQRKANAFAAGRPKPFGSVSERFSRKLPSQAFDPGPGAYEVQKPLPRPRPNQAPIKAGRSGTAQLGGMMARMVSAETPGSRAMLRRRRPRSRKITIMVGDTAVDPSKVRIPAFGTQTDRFSMPGASGDIPPPGAYQIAESFETIKSKGRIQNPSLSSQMTRELFPTLPKGPGPGEYNVLGNNLERPNVKHGAFLSSELRFNAKHEEMPGPGSYLSADYENGLVKKTFNITLRDWNQPINA
ncbi:Sperm-tail PG-rich repeat-containing protein 2 [Phlyctochytrium planicorne]|nr:Sperm-tail PG-rich repeat-containing protein 2 [Phlyctochytrium planicorne]